MNTSIGPGSFLGSYEILSVLGAGGMGEVYRARDRKLGRDVALKVLPEEMASSPSRLERFRREAKLLASLNHPNIVTVHSVEEAAGRQFLTMELVEGKTLSDHIPKHGVGLEEFFELAIVLAEALACAHQQGVVHRDLKPGNIMVTATGVVKILDFGLAKRSSPQQSALQSDASTAFLTGEGIVLGTLPYMSPEQLQGRGVDERSDVFSMGVILYQLATGDRPFAGSTGAELMSAILRDTPVAVDELRREMPHHLARVIRRCLEKDRERRMPSAQELRNALVDLRAELSEVKGTAAPLPSQRSGFFWKAAALLGAVAAVTIYLAISMGWLDLARRSQREMPKPRLPVGRFILEFPGGEELFYNEQAPPPVAISPNGSTVVYVAKGPKESLIHSRRLDQLDAQPISGTEGACCPFFSPDGEWLGFFARGKLKKVPLLGGGSTELADAPLGGGGTWTTSDEILFNPSIGEGLWLIPAAGGEPRAATRLDLDRNEQRHDTPRMLPDGRSALFNVWTGGGYSNARIAVVSLEVGERKTLVEGASHAIYAAPGHLIYSQEGTLFARPFDLERLEISGTPVPVVEDILVLPGLQLPTYDLSTSGVLVYATGGPDPPRSRLVWVDRRGDLVPLAEEQPGYYLPRLSPDGGRIVYHSGDDQFDVWMYDIERAASSRVTFSEGWDGFPIWTPDGGRVTFASGREGVFGLFWKKAAGGGPTETLLSGQPSRWPTSWSPDGGTLIFQELQPATGYDLWLYEVGQAAPRPFLRTRFNERQATFSPDGEWIAYQSDESGRREVYVSPFSAPERRRPVSSEGGSRPLWARDGSELYFMNGGELLAVGGGARPGLQLGRPRVLFSRPNVLVTDVSSDGQRFLASEQLESAAVRQLVTVLNWFEELERLVRED